MLVRPTTALIIVSNPQGIPRLIEAHGHILDALKRRDRDKGRLWVDRHLRDWKAGFERSGLDLDTPVELSDSLRRDDVNAAKTCASLFRRWHRAGKYRRRSEPELDVAWAVAAARAAGRGCARNRRSRGAAYRSSCGRIRARCPPADAPRAGPADPCARDR